MPPPPPARLAPLWRSTGRCLALRPRNSVTVRHSSHAASQSAGAGAATAASGGPCPSATFQHRLRMGQATPVLGGLRSVRGYADDMTTRANGAGDVGAGAGGGDALLSPGSPFQQQQQQLGDAQQHPQSQQAPSPYPPPPQPQQPRRLSEQDRHQLQNQEAIHHLELLAQGLAPFDARMDGHKFGLTLGTSRPSALDNIEGAEIEDPALPRTPSMKKRYDESLALLTRLLMRDGKLAKAQRDMSMILNHLRTSAPPKISPNRPLLPGHPPSAQLPLDPVCYLTTVIDSLAPLMKMRNFAKLAGGGRALPVPAPLALRQRRRVAFMWIIEYAEKRPSRGSGRSMLATRIGDEIISLAEGRSSLWEKRDAIHKLATAARANVMLATRRAKMKKKL